MPCCRGHRSSGDRKGAAVMRRMILLCGTASFLTAFLGGALAFSLAIPKPVAAQSDRQLSGTWLQALAGPAAGQGGNALVTFSSDGTIILSTLGTLTLQPLDGVHRLSSPGYGNWVRIGPRVRGDVVALPLERRDDRVLR